MDIVNRYDKDGVYALLLAIISEKFIDGNTAYFMITGRTIDRTLKHDYWTSYEKKVLMALTNSGLTVNEVAKRMGVSYRKIIEKKTYLKRTGKWDSDIKLEDLSEGSHALA